MKNIKNLENNNIKITKDINLESPTMIAAWPGMGDVASFAVNYLRKELKAEKFAEYRHTGEGRINSVTVKNGVAHLPDESGRKNIYYTEDPELIIFEGQYQLSGKEANKLIKDLLGFAKKMNVKQLYTGGAVASDIKYSDYPHVYAAASSKKLKSTVDKVNARLLTKGNISGMNGTLIGHAGKEEINAICFLATIPVYATGFTNPKAAKALVEIFEKILHTDIDKKELDGYIAKTDKLMESLEDNIEQIIPDQYKKQSQKEKLDIDFGENEVPDQIMEKIEELFEDAKEDRSKIGTLKRELDRWDLFTIYEDRFFNLIKK